MVSYAVMSLNAGAIAGYFAFPPLAERIGRRPAFAWMMAGAAMTLPAIFFVPRSYATVLFMLPVLGFFTNGIFSGFPVYLPELFPTRIRATGAGFCFNAGRIRTVPDGLPGRAPGHFCAGRERSRTDLRGGDARAAVRARDQRAVAGIRDYS
jgi:hypothetical protein